ncbi:MAG: protein-export protein SecB [Alphaproteobacteria bacterium BRH_c36]|nr:MAG: protein-export protein SecB [Alphaproteobacteria bacterium BRH_c36]
MTDKQNGSGKPAEGAAVGGQPGIQAQVVAQYIKDLSFENPNVEKLMSGPGENPNMKLEVNVNARRMSDKEGLFESAIDFKAHATNEAGTIYQLEVVYAGIFRIKNIPEEALEPFLLINCPALIFPYLRRLASDLTREGGFPPLLLDPIDFAGLYVRRKQQEAGSAETPTVS